jgi:hypothetical protein
MQRGAALLLLGVLPWLTLTGGTALARGVPAPVIELPTEGHCIAPPEEMRRNHMEMLKHQRDKTLREGIRGAKASLRGCIECHAGKASGSVVTEHDGFCRNCHAYVAVKLDCWDCHQPKAGYQATGARP